MVMGTNVLITSDKGHFGSYMKIYDLILYYYLWLVCPLAALGYLLIEYCLVLFMKVWCKFLILILVEVGKKYTVHFL